MATTRRHTLIGMSVTIAAMLLMLTTASAVTRVAGQLAPADAAPFAWATAPILRCSNRTAVVPMQWIVQTNNNESTYAVLGALPATLAALTSAALAPLSAPLPFGVGLDASVLFVYEHALNGFALRFNVLGPSILPDSLTPAKVVDAGVTALAAMPGVLLLEEDARLHGSFESQQLPSNGAQWSLDRVDQRPRAGDNRYYFNRTGTVTHVYVLDTGIRKSHEQFEGRADWSFSAFDRSSPPQADDGHGHGTHVAGTVGGRTYGVAKAAMLHAVKVLDTDGSGTDSGVAAGLDWVAKNAVKPAVAVMSLGGSPSSTLDSAVRNAVSRGISVVVAAGNSDANACDSSPARVAVAITVAASDQADARSSFSNHGSCVTMFAPGSRILSASHDSDSGSTVMSGTSMAAPHVAGAVAVYLSKFPSATPAAVKDDLICYSTKDALSDPKDSPNRLLYSIVGTGGSAKEGSDGSGGATSPLPSTSPPPDTANSEQEQCTSASPCVGPLAATLASANAIARFPFNTTGVAGFHRAWLSYNTGGGSILNPQRVNDMSLLRWDNVSSSWQVVASATDSSNSKRVVHEDVSGVSTSWAWLVRARGDTPSEIRLTYKVPAAAMVNEPNPAPGTDVCSATPRYDPDPSTPNNPGQDPRADNAAAVPAFSLSVPLLSALALAASALWLRLD